MDQDRLHKALLILLVLLAAGLRLPGLDRQPLWWDEGYSLYASNMPVGSMIAETAEDIHPPLYYVLLHVWQTFAGTTPTAVRLFSVFIGVLSVAILFRLGHHLAGLPLAAWAAAFLAASPLHVYYSQEVRMYALLTLLGLVSTHAMLLWLERQKHADADGNHRHGIPVAYLLSTAAALYTHYYAVFIPLAHTAFVLLHSRRAGSVRNWLVTQIILALSYLPWVLFTIGRLTSYVGGKVAIEQYHPLGPFDFLTRHITAFSVGHVPEAWGALSWLSLIFLALATLGAITGPQATRRNVLTGLWALYLVVPLADAYAINLFYPFHPDGFERLILFAVPAYYLLAALGIISLWRGHRYPTMAAVGCVLLVNALSLWTFYATPRYTADDYRPLIRRLVVQAHPGDVVFCLYPWQIGYFHSYYPPDRPYLEPAFEQDWPARRQDPTLLPNYLDGLMARHGRLWFPSHQIGGRILEEEIAAYLATHYHTVVSEWANPHTRLYLFSGQDELREVPGGINFGDRVRLVGYALPDGPVTADWDIVNVELRWELTAPLDGPYFVGLRLSDEANYTWAQRSAEPVGGLEPFSTWTPGRLVSDRHGLFVSADIPPGLYTVKAGIYRRGDGRGLEVINPAGAPVGTEATLGTVEVVLAPEPPAVDRVEIPHRTETLFATSPQEATQLRLLGYHLPETNYRPGSQLQFVLFWQPLTPIPEDLTVNVRLTGEDQHEIELGETRPVFGRYPTSRWESGYTVRDPHRVIIPPQTPRGRYHLRIGLSDADRSGADAWGENTATLGTVQVTEGRTPHFDPPDVPRPLRARLGTEILLLGHEQLPKEVKPGDTIELTLYWQALEPTLTSYTAFVHLLDGNSRIWGQIDTIPGQGTLPTTGWVPGEYLRDTYRFQVKPNTPAGRYKIELGMYDATTGARLPTELSGTGERSDHIVLGTEIIVQ